MQKKENSTKMIQVKKVRNYTLSEACERFSLSEILFIMNNIKFRYLQTVKDGKDDILYICQRLDTKRYIILHSACFGNEPIEIIKVK